MNAGQREHREGEDGAAGAACAAGDAGFATVAVIGICGVLGATAMAGVLLGGVVAARHRAGAAADLAAIAAAQQALDPRGACRRAAQLAARDGAVVELCRVSGAVVEVRVRVAVPGPLGRLGPARATARAGPARGD